MVYLSSDTVTAQECMDRESKIECRTVLRHSLDFSFGGEDKNFGCKQVQFDGIEEIERIRLWIVQNFLNGLPMQGLTSDDEEERKELLETLLATDADCNVMHEGFDCQDPKKFTREWFAWANSLFALFALSMKK